MGKRDFKRKTESRRQNPRFLIVSEGEATEPEYMRAVMKLRKVPSAEIMFVPPPPTSPKEIVTKARDLKKEARADDKYDAVWCIFDVEAKVSQAARPGLAEALQMATANNISVALSNPCFELWILLHTEDCRGSIYSGIVQHRCKSCGLVDGKHISNPNELLGSYQIACERARALDSMHQLNGTQRIEDQNPSTGVYKLVEAILEAFPPRL